MNLQHRDNIKRQREEETAVTPTFEPLTERPSPPSPARSWLAAIIAAVNLLSVTAVFWLSLLGYLETRQVGYGLFVFLIMALLGYFIGQAKMP